MNDNRGFIINLMISDFLTKKLLYEVLEKAYMYIYNYILMKIYPGKYLSY